MYSKLLTGKVSNRGRCICSNHVKNIYFQAL